MAMSFVHVLAPAANALIPDITAFMVHSTMLAIGALAVVWLLRHRSMAAQSLVLKTFLLLILLCPVLMYLLRGADIMLFSVPVPIEQAGTETAQTPLFGDYLDHLLTRNTSELPARSGITAAAHVVDTEEAPILRDYALLLQEEAVPEPVVSSTGPGWRTYVYVGLFVVWIVMALYFAFRLLYGFAVIMFIRMTAHTAEVSAYRFGHLAARRYHVPLPRLLRSRYISSPLLAGVFRPVIILPDHGEVSPEIIAHELSHYMRGDCFWNLIGQLAHVVIPLQPLVLLLNHLMEDISDYISDDFVVESKFDPRQYAFALVRYAEYSRTRAHSLHPAVQFFSGRSGLKSRVERILSTSARRRLVNGKGAVLGIGVAGVALTLSIAAVTFEASAITLTDSDANVIRSVLLHKPQAFPEKTDDNMQVSGETDNLSELTGPVSESSDTTVHPETVRPELTAEIEPMTEPDRTLAENRTDDGQPLETVGQPDEEPTTSPATGLYALLTYPELETKSVTETSEPDPVHIDDRSNPLPPTTLAGEESVMESDIAFLVTPQTPIIDESTLDVTALHTYKECMDMGMVMFDGGRYFKALELYKRAARLRPGNADANFHIGFTYYKIADLQKAKMFLQIAIAQDPDHDEAYLRLGDTIRDMGDLDAAWDQYKIAFDINPALAKEKKEIF